MPTRPATVPHPRHRGWWLGVAVLGWRCWCWRWPWAASPAAAAGCDGVTVLVERPSGAVTERCAPGRPADGLAALETAGFAYTFVSGQPGFVCTIDRFPDPCNGAPADAYWSYWSAEPGSSTWTYNTRGGASRTPAPGSSDAWVFGAGRPPRLRPPPRRRRPHRSRRRPPTAQPDTGGAAGEAPPRERPSDGASGAPRDGSTTPRSPGDVPPGEPAAAPRVPRHPRRGPAVRQQERRHGRP